jgi:hypothetical protein
MSKSAGSAKGLVSYQMVSWDFNTEIRAIVIPIRVAAREECIR